MDGCREGYRSIEADRKTPICQVGSKPFQNSASDVNRCSRWEIILIYSVKCSSEIKEVKNGRISQISKNLE